MTRNDNLHPRSVREPAARTSIWSSLIRRLPLALLPSLSLFFPIAFLSTATASAASNFAGYQMAFQSPSGSMTDYGATATTSSGAVMSGTSPDLALLSNGGYETAFQNSGGVLQSVGTGPGGFDADWGLGMQSGTSPSITGLPAGGAEIAFQASTGTLWTVGTGPGSFDADWGLGMQPGTSPSITALPAGGVEVTFQDSSGQLWTVGLGGTSFDAQWPLGMHTDASPSITALPAGGVEVAFEANTGHLWTVGNGTGASDTTWGLTLASSSSPSITAVSPGGFETASQGSNGDLWTTGASGSPTDTGQAMKASTSPSIASSGTDYEAAVQSSSGHLVEFGTSTTVDTGQSMLAGTSPAIAPPPGSGQSSGSAPDFAGYQMAFQSPSGSMTDYGATATTSTGAVMAGTSPDLAVNSFGGYETAFQNSGGVLQSVGSGTGGFNANWGLGMRPGTSPSITGLPDGGVEVAFQASTGTLWTVGTGPGSFDADWGLGMLAGTSPSITALPAGGVEVTFQDSSGQLWTVGNGGASFDAKWPLGMMAATSPSITALPTGGVEVAFQANTGRLWTVGNGAGASDTTWTVALSPGTSPSITAISPGGFETASQGMNGDLWTTGASGTPTDTGKAMMALTSPSIASSGSDYEAAVQSASGHLVEFGSSTTVDTGQAMMAATSPTIAPPPPPAQAAGSPYGAGATGYDISWPQCGGAYPPQAPVAVVGVNDGSAYTSNPCFANEASWGGSNLTVYINMNSPQGSNSSEYLQGPAGNCTLGDLNCESYNYGYNSAVAAMQVALGNGYRSYTWWLDVETGNYWTSDTSANAEVIAGALAAIRGAGYQVAIYSTNYQWSQIVGSYVPSAPAWYPTGTATSTPYNWCSASSFAGGPIFLVQSAAGNYDGDYSC